MIKEEKTFQDMKDIGQFKGMKVLIIGMGLSGVASAKLLNEFGADIRITDQRDEIELAANIMQLPEGITIETGRHTSTMIVGVDLVVVSPGISPENPILKEARLHGIPVISEIELSYLFSRSIPWIAVTGTNGKSTTTTLIDLILREAGYNIITGGNIGVPISGVIKDILFRSPEKRIDYIVAEISSFQLETIEKFKPHIAAILNITPDHLDRYKDMDEYISAKSNIFKNMTVDDRIILNFDDPLVRKFGSLSTAETYFFSAKNANDHIAAYLKDDKIWINEQVVINLHDMALRGAHNIENVLAASLAAVLAGADIESMKDVLREFKGLKHRLEYVETIDSVSFYNDSKGTNIGAVIKSLESFDHSVVLILGGKDKGADFTALIPYIKGRVRAVVAIGDCRGKIERQLMNVVRIIKVNSMKDAVETAYSVAKPSGVVLLSPGCASFDMFRNFEHRGDVFKKEVYRLRHDRTSKRI